MPVEKRVAAAAATLFSTGIVDLDSSHTLPFSLGALVGIVSWFFVLLRLVAHFRERFSYASLTRVIRGMGWAQPIPRITLVNEA